MKKYALYPGNVRSANDGQTHYINGPQLAKLYGVKLDECVVIIGDRPNYDAVGLIPLRPSQYGSYILPKADSNG